MRTTKVQTQGHLLLVCECCEAPSVQRLVRRSRWFGLGGRHLIPLGHAYVLHCTLCGAAGPITNDLADRLAHDVHAVAPVSVDPDFAHDVLDPKDH